MRSRAVRLALVMTLGGSLSGCPSADRSSFGGISDEVVVESGALAVVPGTSRGGQPGCAVRGRMRNLTNRTLRADATFLAFDGAR